MASRYPTGSAFYTDLPCELPEMDSLACVLSHLSDTLAGLSQVETNNDLTADTCLVAAATVALVNWDMVRKATSSDPVFMSPIQHLQDGFPEDFRQLPADLRPFYRYAFSMCVVDGVILMGQRILIPAALCPDILKALHAAHQGVSLICVHEQCLVKHYN